MGALVIIALVAAALAVRAPRQEPFGGVEGSTSISIVRSAIAGSFTPGKLSLSFALPWPASEGTRTGPWYW